MKKSGMQMTENRVKFLKSVPLLSSLNTEVLIKMTDLLKLVGSNCLTIFLSS